MKRRRGTCPGVMEAWIKKPSTGVALVNCGDISHHQELMAARICSSDRCNVYGMVIFYPVRISNKTAGRDDRYSAIFAWSL